MKYRNIVAILFFGLVSIPSFSQEIVVVTDSIAQEEEKRLSLNLDIVSRYLWRGQCWGRD